MDVDDVDGNSGRKRADIAKITETKVSARAVPYVVHPKQPKHATCGPHDAAIFLEKTEEKTKKQRGFQARVGRLSIASKAVCNAAHTRTLPPK